MVEGWFNLARLHNNFKSENLTLEQKVHKYIMDKKYSVKSEKWKIETYVLMKNIISDNQQHLTIQHMDNKLITDILTKNI